MIISVMGVPSQAAGLVRSGIGGVSAGDSLEAAEEAATESSAEQETHAALSSTIGTIARSGITTVTGSFLTKGSVSGVSIDPSFDGEHNITF